MKRCILPTICVVILCSGCDWFSTDEASLDLSADSVELLALAGSTTPVTSDVSLQYDGGWATDWRAVFSEPWLSVTPSSGVILPGGSTQLTISADPDLLPEGSYEDTVTILCAAGTGTSARLTVTFGVASVLQLAPSSLSFTADQGDTTTLTDTTTLQCIGGANVNWNSVSSETWLAVTPSSGLLSGGPESLTVSVTPEGSFTPGLYSAQLTVLDTGGVLTAVTLDVYLYIRPTQDDSALLVTDRTVHLYAQEGDALSSTEDVTVQMCRGAAVSWAATPADSWLLLDGSASPATGSLSDAESATLTFSADTAALTDALYESSVTFSTPGGEARDVIVKVALTVRPATAGAYMAYFISDIDDSMQRYGIYVPTSYSRGTPAPVVMILHGYGGLASTSFIAAITTRADANGWILVRPEGRGQHQYESTSSVDLFEVLDDIDGNYGIDSQRVFLEGASMGATGSYRHLSRHPDVFAGAAGCDGWADFRLWHNQWYSPKDHAYEFHPVHESNLDQSATLWRAENLRPDRLFMIVDTGDLAVYSEAGPKLRYRLDRLGTGLRYEQYPGGHCSSYDQDSMHGFFVNEVAPLDADPDTVRLQSNRLRTAKNAWLQVERLGWDCYSRAEMPFRPDQSVGYGTTRTFGFATPATMEVTRSVGAGTCTFTASSRNVSRFTITSAPVADDYIVDVNGQTCASFAQGAYTFPLTISLSLDAQGEVSSGSIYASTPPLLEKKPDVEGPVDRAVCSRFIVAYGSSNTTFTANNKYEADEFCKYWEDIWNSGTYGFKATITSVDEADLTESDIQSSNILLFGSEESSMLMARVTEDPALPFNLPVRILEDSITIGEDVFTGGEHGIWMAYPNPMAPGRMLAIGHNVVGSTPGLYGAIFWTQDAYAWFWPDYVVFKTDETPREEVDNPYYAPDQYVLAGHFDRDWGFPSFSRPLTLPALTTSAPSYDAGATTDIPVEVTVTDESGAVVTGLVSEAFDARIDGEARTATFSEKVGFPGTYEALVPVTDFVDDILAGSLTGISYDITVEVVRQVSTELVGGRARARFTIVK